MPVYRRKGDSSYAAGLLDLYRALWGETEHAALAQAIVQRYPFEGPPWRPTLVQALMPTPCPSVLWVSGAPYGCSRQEHDDAAHTYKSDQGWRLTWNDDTPGAER